MCVCPDLIQEGGRLLPEQCSSTSVMLNVVQPVRQFCVLAWQVSVIMVAGPHLRG